MTRPLTKSEDVGALEDMFEIVDSVGRITPNRIVVSRAEFAQIRQLIEEKRIKAVEGQLWLVLHKARATDYKDMGIFEDWLSTKHADFEAQLKGKANQ